MDESLDPGPDPEGIRSGGDLGRDDPIEGEDGIDRGPGRGAEPGEGVIVLVGGQVDGVLPVRGINAR
ncbi:hypothetical protein D5S18_25055 [Nocardia panacis]|uniref:Uncharacterized protein n=1 Tax=Nocardia panacis TaxID=2340916 RepID=A0A3A4KCC7_9NOCA|nr:hypothetical protein [Nocardia panacis]RJO71440.1 hypothetical protein D5S18_25055 [Nocardia panacis]